MKTAILGRSLGKFLSAPAFFVIVLFACSPQVDTPKPPSVQPPTVSFSSTPSATESLLYGDSIIVTCTSSVNTSAIYRLRPLKDTVVTFTATNSGGTTTGSLNIKVSQPDPFHMLLVSGQYKLVKKQAQLSTGELGAIAFHYPEDVQFLTFDNNFRFSYTHSTGGEWMWHDGRSKIEIGINRSVNSATGIMYTNIWTFVSLTSAEMVIKKMTPAITPGGQPLDSVLTIFTYSRTPR